MNYLEQATDMLLYLCLIPERTGEDVKHAKKEKIFQERKLNTSKKWKPTKTRVVSINNLQVRHLALFTLISLLETCNIISKNTLFFKKMHIDIKCSISEVSKMSNVTHTLMQENCAGVGAINTKNISESEGLFKKYKIKCLKES